MEPSTQPQYQGHRIRIRLMTLGARFRAGYAIDEGTWQDAQPSESRDWAMGVAEYAARREIDRLKHAMDTR